MIRASPPFPFCTLTTQRVYVTRSVSTNWGALKGCETDEEPSNWECQCGQMRSRTTDRFDQDSMPSPTTKEPVSNLQLVFVHGLGGNAHDTWRQGKNPSLVDYVREHDGIKCTCYEYPTSLLRLPLMRKMSPIEILAAGLRTTIDHKIHTENDLILVGHSLGGLIARWYVANLLDQDARRRVKHLVLYATPNHGAALARVGRLLSWHHFQLKQLCKNSDFINNLNDRWAEHGISHSIPTTCVIGGQDDVVTEESGTLKAHGAREEVLVDKDHRDIVKPLSTDDLCYRVLRSVIKGSSESQQRPQAPTPAPSQLGNLLQESRAAYSNSQFARAYSSIRDARTLYPEDVEVSRQYVRVCFAQQNHAAVERLLGETPPRLPADELATFRGELYLRRREWNQAVDALTTIEQRTLPNVEYLTGTAYQFAFTVERDPLKLVYARNHFREAQRHFPDNWWVRVNLMLTDLLIHRASGRKGQYTPSPHDIAETKQLIQRAIEEEPQLLSARFYRLLLLALLRDKVAFRQTAADDRVIFNMPNVDTPKNFPASFLMRLELLFETDKAALRYYTRHFHRSLFGGDRDG